MECLNVLGGRRFPVFGNQTSSPSLGVSWSGVLEALGVLLILGWPRMRIKPCILGNVWVVLISQAFTEEGGLLGGEKQKPGWG